MLGEWIPVAGQNLTPSRAYLKKNDTHVGGQRYQHHFEKFLCGKTQAGEPKQNIDRVSALYFDLPHDPGNTEWDFMPEFFKRYGMQVERRTG